MRPSNDHTQASLSCLLALPLALTLWQPMPEQFVLLAAQSASVHERRPILRERQRIPLAPLPLLVIPHPSEREEDGGCLSPGSSEEPRPRFSHSSPSSPVVSRRTCNQPIDGTDLDVAQAMHSPALPASPAPRPKRKSMLAKLMKAFAP